MLLATLVTPVAALPSKSSVGTGNLTIDATLFEVDGKRNVVLASGNVVVTQGDVVINGKTGTYYKASQKIVLSGDVRVVRGAMNLTCQTAIAYAIDNRVEVSGDVKFLYEDIHGTAGLGVYSRKEQTVLLSGSPVVWQNRDVLSGKSILVDIQKNKVTTYGGAKAVFSAEKFSGR